MADLANRRSRTLHESDANADVISAVKMTALKQASPSFVVMRRLAMRFCGILRGDDPSKLGRWLNEARRSGIRSMQQSARTLCRDLDAVKNAIS